MSSSTNPAVDSTMSDDLTDAPEADICILLPNETRLSGEGYKHDSEITLPSVGYAQTLIEQSPQSWTAWILNELCTWTRSPTALP